MRERKRTHTFTSYIIKPQFTNLKNLLTQYQLQAVYNWPYYTRKPAKHHQVNLSNIHPIPQAREATMFSQLFPTGGAVWQRLTDATTAKRRKRRKKLHFLLLAVIPSTQPLTAQDSNRRRSTHTEGRLPSWHLKRTNHIHAHNLV